MNLSKFQKSVIKKIMKRIIDKQSSNGIWHGGNVTLFLELTKQEKDAFLFCRELIPEIGAALYGSITWEFSPSSSTNLLILFTEDK